MDTWMLKGSDQPDAQRKRTVAQVSGAKKKEKDHRKKMETSLTEDDIELIAMTI
jgi:NACalpha-BTF3-like transcription factor